MKFEMKVLRKCLEAFFAEKKGIWSLIAWNTN